MEHSVDFAVLAGCGLVLIAVLAVRLSSRTGVPALLVYGRLSNFYTEAAARFVAGQIRGSTLHLYDDADHCPHLLQPQRFLEDFAAFTRADNAPNA